MLTQPVKILLYTHDTMGMGHITRALKLIRAIRLAAEDAVITIITGNNTLQCHSIPDTIDVIKLPTVRLCQTGTERISKSVNGLDISTVFQIREEIIFDTVRLFKPDYFLVDFSIFGEKNELVKSLLHLKKAGTTRICLMLRDILWDLETFAKKWNRKNYSGLLEKVYDRIFVFGDRNMFDMGREYGFSGNITGKITYFGYLVNKTDPVASRNGRVLLCVGGGTDGFQMIDRILSLSKREYTVVTGPYISQSDFEYLQKTYPGIPLIRDTPDLYGMIAESECVISMLGYNTFCELLQSNTPAIVMPRVHPDKEQLLRAQIFNRHGLFDYIEDIGSLDAGRLETLISNAIKEHKDRTTLISRINTDGIANFAVYFKDDIRTLPAGVQPASIATL